MKKLFLILILALGGLMTAFCQPVDLQKATEAAVSKLHYLGAANSVRSHEFFGAQTASAFYLFNLDPAGYMIVPASMELPSVLAYSLTGSTDPEGRLIRLVAADLASRLQYQPEAVKQRYLEAWHQPGQSPVKSPLFQQWPEPGTTATGGWLETNWTQNAPYNNLCPMDLVSGSRSIAGCPAVAMAQIVNFHKTINGVVFYDEDDYYHSYAGRNYMIDDDWQTVDFPSFPTLNGYLDTLQMSYNDGTPLKNRDKAALTFACGVAARQVYTSSAAGTFGVNQALEAYIKFNFDYVVLLTDADTTLYPHMAQNIKDTLPVHLAVVDPAGTMGHNVVVDGYNTDEYFHLNFGWGGPYNGWYLLPEEIPYGLTVIEGAVVDIIPDYPVGVVQKDDRRVRIYPNPASRVVYIDGMNGKFGTAELVSPDGRSIRKVKLNTGETPVDLSGIPAGLYLVRLTGSGAVEAQKLLIGK
jgi:hypothetical protein